MYMSLLGAVSSQQEQHLHHTLTLLLLPPFTPLHQAIKQLEEERAADTAQQIPRVSEVLNKQLLGQQTLSLHTLRGSLPGHT